MSSGAEYDHLIATSAGIPLSDCEGLCTGYPQCVGVNTYYGAHTPYSGCTPNCCALVFGEGHVPSSSDYPSGYTWQFNNVAAGASGTPTNGHGGVNWQCYARP